jgi:hypothetical protein
MFHLLAMTMNEWKVWTRSLNSTLEGAVTKLGLARNVRNLRVCGTDTDMFVEHEL